MTEQALDSYTVSLTLRSLKINLSDPPNRKKGVTLQQVQKQVEYCQLKGLLGFTLRLAIVLGFFALLRISNLAPISISTYDPHRDSTRQDLTFEPPGLQFRQRWAKNGCRAIAHRRIPHRRIPHRRIAHRRIAHQDLSLVGQLLTSGQHNFILFYLSLFYDLDIHHNTC